MTSTPAQRSTAADQPALLPDYKSRRPSRPRGVLCFLDVHPCVHASWFGGGGGGGVGEGV